MLRSNIKNAAAATPGFFVLGVVFCFVVEFGPSPLGGIASDALLGLINPNPLILLFICELFVMSVTLVTVGSLSESSGDVKRKIVRYTVDSPAIFISSLALPAVAIILSITIFCAVFKYWAYLPVFALGAVYYAIFAGAILGLILPTRERFLSRLGSELEGGRIAGMILFIITCALCFLYYYVT